MTVAIVIPCHNSVATLPRTIESVKAQTVTDWRIIAVDDASKDETPAMLAAMAGEDPRITVIAGSGIGASGARNAALASIEDDFIGFLDSDDLWEPERLAVFLRHFSENPGSDIAYSRYAFFGEEPGDNPTQSTVPDHSLSVLDLMRENPVGTMSNLILRRSAMERAGPFREDVTHGEDREWLVRAVAHGLRVDGIDGLLLHYRTSVGGLSTDLEKMYGGWRESLRTAETMDARPSEAEIRSAEAVYLRYLSRRSMRLGMPPRAAATYALRGVMKSPRGFFSDGKRGPLTLGSALAGLIAPRVMRNALSNR
jgi:glycosyltransferase involved in cell wall biosynthesis